MIDGMVLTNQKILPSNPDDIKSFSIAVTTDHAPVINNIGLSDASDSELFEYLAGRVILKADLKAEKSKIDTLMKMFFRIADSNEKKILINLFKKIVRSS